MPELASNLRISWDTVQKMVTDWSERTFPASTPESVYKHLKKEVRELGLAMKFKGKRRKRNVGEESADCILLLLHLNRKLGNSVYAEVEKKFGVNTRRKWGKPNKDGFQEHVR